MPTLVDLDGLVSLSEAGRELGVSADRVRQLADEGTLPVYWSPLGRLVPADAVRALAEKRSQQGRGG
jgi:hypothetical protein